MRLFAVSRGNLAPLRRILLCFGLCASPQLFWGQGTLLPGVNNATAFLAEVALKYPGAALTKSVTLNVGAKWTLGSQKESGTAVLVANADGTSNIQLTLDQASRTESRTALGDSRSCQWTDQKGTQQLNDVDCNMPVAWFAPLLAVQPIPAVLNLLNISDDGQVQGGDGPLRRISYLTPLQGTTDKFTSFLTQGTRTSILFDPLTLLPSRLEYLQHADKDLNTTFPVRIVYSNYQMVAGIPVPYQIDRYVNGALQLSLTVTSASLQ